MPDTACAGIVLAAGASTRMGRPKQLLPVGGLPLVRHVALEGLRSDLSPVVVVLGAHAAEIRPHLADLPVLLAENAAWAEGMGSSLRAGLAAALAKIPDLVGVLVILADQPEIRSAHLKEIMALGRTGGHSIVASRFNTHVGPPGYFGRPHFARLQSLSGDTGARGLLHAFGAGLVAVPVAASDLDSPADYARYLARTEGRAPLDLGGKPDTRA